MTKPAHSMSEFRRIKAQGGEVTPPAQPAPNKPLPGLTPEEQAIVDTYYPSARSDVLPKHLYDFAVALSAARVELEKLRGEMVELGLVHSSPPAPEEAAAWGWRNVRAEAAETALREHVAAQHKILDILEPFSAQRLRDALPADTDERITCKHANQSCVRCVQRAVDLEAQLSEAKATIAMQAEAIERQRNLIDAVHVAAVDLPDAWLEEAANCNNFASVHQWTAEQRRKVLLEFARKEELRGHKSIAAIARGEAAEQVK